MKLIYSLAATALLMMGVGVASAATLDGTDISTLCSDVNPNVTNNVLNNELCLITDATENLDGDFTSAGGTFFDFLDKDNAGEFGDGGDLTITGDTKDGTWSINNFSAGMLYALVFKDGANALPDSQIMYIVSEGSGTYTSPFYNDIGGTTQKDISFVSLFEVTPGGDCCTRTTVTPIPLPAGMVLLGTGIVALGVWSRRKKS